MSSTSASNSLNVSSTSSVRLDLSGVNSLIYHSGSLSKDASQALASHDVDGLIYDSDSDISHEAVAEKKIVKIDRKLHKHREMDKVEKRRLQNRKSALKCRLRKSHTIASLTKEVTHLKEERKTLYEEVFIIVFKLHLDCRVKR